MILRNCDMKSFSDRCRGKNLVCYGIGGEFSRIIKSYSGYEWIQNISVLADGNSKNEGMLVDVMGRQYSMIGLEQLKKSITSDTVILITCMAYYEIVNTLNEIKEFDGVESYLFHFMFSLSEGDEITIRNKETQLIPKTIHYCWFGKKEKPDLYKRCIESWHKYCPDYEIKEWNEENCDINETIFTKQAYEHGKYGFVPDYFRLKIIYKNGGIYLDTDVEILKEIDDLLYNEAFCGLEFPGEAALGLGFGAVRGNALVAKLMMRYKNMPFVNADGTINEIGSPVLQSEDLLKLGMTYKNQLQSVEGMTIYPIEILSPQNVYTGITNITHKTLMWHHYDGSWVSGERLQRKEKRLREAAAIQKMIEESERNQIK